MVFLPNNVRPGVLSQLAEAHIHRFGEKPVPGSACALAATAEAIARNGVVFYPGYQWRLHPLVRTIKGIVDRVPLGDLTPIAFRHVTSSVTLRDPQHYLFPKEQSGGGFLNWLACHWFELARFITSREISSVMACTDNLSGEAIDVESAAAVASRFDDGACPGEHSLGAPEEVADLSVSLSSEASSCITGTTVDIHGGGGG
jgi:predicted dehydrogenase